MEQLYVTDGTYEPTIFEYNISPELEPYIEIVSSYQDLPNGDHKMRIDMSYIYNPSAYDFLFENFFV